MTEKIEIPLNEISEIKMTAEMESLVDRTLATIDEDMTSMKPSDRFVLGIRLSTAITAATLANGLKDQRHLLNPAIEALAEDWTDATEQIFAAYDETDLVTFQETM